MVDAKYERTLLRQDVLFMPSDVVPKRERFVPSRVRNRLPHGQRDGRKECDRPAIRAKSGWEVAEFPAGGDLAKRLAR